MVKEKQLAFSSPLSHPTCTEAHVSWRWRWYINCPQVALGLMVAAPGWYEWILEGLCYWCYDNSSIQWDFSSRICSQQHIHIRSPVLPNFSSSHLFYLAVLACWPVTVRVSGYIDATVYGGIVIFAVVAYSLLFLFSRYDSGHSCWSVNVMVRGTIFSTVEEEFIVI